jgi:hypothetical protein
VARVAVISMPFGRLVARCFSPERRLTDLDG